MIFTGTCMRIIRILFLLLVTISSVYSDEFFTQSSLVDYRPIGMIGDVGVDFKIMDSAVCLRYNGNWSGSERLYFSFKEENVEIKEDGFLYTILFEWEKCILLGSRFFLIMNPESERYRHGYKNIGTREAFNLGTRHATFNETLIKSIESTSFLKEADTLYLPDLLDKYLGYYNYNPTTGTRPPMQVLNGDALPWVEGVEGPGIGEQLIITFTEPSNDIVVLNGFVDRNRKHLFKDNNRVKTAIIRSDDSGEPFEFEYFFEDIVQFDEIRFPRPAEKIIFEIKDVYPGEKWDDTCISAVLTREPDPYINTDVKNDVDEEEQEKKVYSPDER